uniref:Uncharacterized protein n=1 Tax=Physcomitrium patens TaxID=3218 RepID=A0A2K1JZ97_PHYPA|nr:hypothetical protein PHYPA_013965 [Physcomitrium patens]
MEASYRGFVFVQYHAYLAVADPANLQKCEELLKGLPARTPTPVRNPTWVFLKGIEGFGYERASDCLVRLLNNHYYTIDDLKLATEQDLVNYAGIKAGDALQIVAAAKKYVVSTSNRTCGVKTNSEIDVRPHFIGKGHVSEMKTVQVILLQCVCAEVSDYVNHCWFDCTVLYFSPASVDPLSRFASFAAPRFGLARPHGDRSRFSNTPLPASASVVVRLGPRWVEQENSGEEWNVRDSVRPNQRLVVLIFVSRL